MGVTVSSEPRLFYLRDADRNPIGAIAFVVEPADHAVVAVGEYAAKQSGVTDEERDLILARRPVLNGYAARLTATLCHPDDQFVKKTAHVRTLGRLKSVLTTFIAAPQDGVGHAAPEIPAQHIMRLMNMPIREEIDWDRANELLAQQLRLAYEKCVAKDPNPEHAPRPELPEGFEDDEPEAVMH